MCYSALEHYFVNVWQLKVHGNRRGQANEPLNRAPSLKTYHT